MKNFDLDQIKNRQLQEMPDEFYEKMQQNVLDSTILKNESFEIGKKSNFTWYYATAASLAILFGGVYFFNIKDVMDNPLLTTTQKVSKKIPEQNTSDRNTRILSIVDPIESTEISPKIKKVIIVNNAPDQATLSKNTSKASIKTAKAQKPEDQIDFLLENFTAEEIATLAKNSDKDVYLDLYN